MRILLLRTDRVGDTLLSLPAATALKRADPACRVAFLASPYTAPLLRLSSDVDEVLLYEKSGRHQGMGGLRRLAEDLRAWRADACVHLHPRAPEVLAARLAGIPRRVGVRGRWYAPLFTDRVPLRRSRSVLHESEGNLRLLEPLLGRVPERSSSHLSLPTPLLEGLPGLPTVLARRPYAVIHPGCGDSAPNLDVRRFRLLAARLLETTDWELALTGSSAEAGLVDEVAAGLEPQRVHRLAGSVDLVGLAGLLAGARLLLAGSTGPLHLAGVVGTPVLSWFCPAPTRCAARWGPLGQLEWALQPEVAPCRSRRRCPHGNCLDALDDAFLLERLEARLRALSAA